MGRKLEVQEYRTENKTEITSVCLEYFPAEFPQEQILFCEIVQLGSNTFSTALSPGEWLGRALQWRQELWAGRAELLVPSGACTLLVTGRCWSQGGCPEPHNEEEVLGRQQGWAGLCCTVRSLPGWYLGGWRLQEQPELTLRCFSYFPPPQVSLQLWLCHVIFNTLLNVLCPSCLSCPGK